MCVYVCVCVCFNGYCRKELDSTSRVQILDETVCIFFCANALDKVLIHLLSPSYG